MFRKLVLLTLIMSIFLSCYKESNYNPSNRELNNLLSISTTSNSIPADGSSRMSVIIKGLPDDISDSDNNIILETDHGSFDGSAPSNRITLLSTLQYDSVTNSTKRQAVATLISATQVDSVHLRATIKGVSKNKTVYFYPALPNRITILPSTIYAKASYTNPITIAVELFRDTGVVSLNTIINFTATDTAINTPSHSVGVFQVFANRSNAMGKCNFSYLFTDSTFQGPIKLKAFVPAATPVQSDSINLIIYK